MNVSPEQSAQKRIKVRRFVAADIPNIMALHKALGSLALKRTLTNNTVNDFFCCLVMMDAGKLVGVLISRLISDPLTDNISTNQEQRLIIQRAKYYAFTEAFYILDEYRTEENLATLFEEYRTWASRRNAYRATINNKLMPEFDLNLTPVCTMYEV